MNKNTSWKSKFYFILTLIFVYVLLFEFILPVNKILPRPSLLLDTFSSIWRDYNLLQSIGLTTSVVYVSIILAYPIIWMKSRFIIRASRELNISMETLRVFRFIPIFLIVVFLVSWFSNSVISEFVFALIVASFLLGTRLFTESKNVKSEYLLVGKNLGLSQNRIYSKIIWKAAEPEVLKSLVIIHFYLWGLVLIYEFIANIAGLGGVLSFALSYNDFASIFALTIIISILICIGNYIIEFIIDRLAPWEQ